MQLYRPYLPHGILRHLRVPFSVLLITCCLTLAVRPVLGSQDTEWPSAVAADRAQLPGVYRGTIDGTSGQGVLLLAGTPGELSPGSSAAISFVGLRQTSRLSGPTSVMIQASDPAGITKIDLLSDQNLVATLNVVPSSSSVIAYFLWNTSTASNGKHMLQARLTNTSGATVSAHCSVFTHNFPLPPPTGNTILVNPFIRHQVMRGWEATSQAGQYDSLAWNNYKNALLDQAVNDLGLNRIRLEIYSGTENPVDYFAQWRAGTITESQYMARAYEIINDDSNPNTINPSGFKWTALDSTIEALVIPLRQRLQARGESLCLSVNYVDFNSSAFEHKDAPAEYAEFVLATYQHIQSRYGFVPDQWEVALEPDSAGAQWSAAQVAAAIKAAGDRLSASGFTPAFVAPSTTNTANAPVYIDQIAATFGAMQYMKEFSYHRYCCASEGILQAIASRAMLYGKQTAMLEWISADQDTLHQDIKTGRNSSWQQYTLAGPLRWGPDGGDRYYLIDDANVNNPVITMGSRTKFLRQYFKFIRAGAQRIDAVSANSTFDPLAFINTNGKYVVVVKASAGGSFNIAGLPGGTYGIKFTTASQYNIDLSDVTINSGQNITTSIPAAGVITIYAR